MTIKQLQNKCANMDKKIVSMLQQTAVLKHEMAVLIKADQDFKNRWPKEVLEMQKTLEEGNRVFGIDYEKDKYQTENNHMNYENEP